MAFAGAAVFLAAGARTGQTRHLISEITGLTLGVFVAAPAVRTNGDAGVLSSNGGAIDAVPASTTGSGLAAAFGPGPDNWAQGDVDALTVLMWDQAAAVTKLSVSKALVANVAAAPAGSTITNNNAEVTIHNLGAGAATILVVRMILEHTSIR